MKTLYQDVCEFNKKFDLPSPETRKPGSITSDEFHYRYDFLVEELNEYYNAILAGNLIKAADALADLVYVALGTAAFHGFPFDEIWEVVHAANMEKIRTPTAETSKRGSRFDVIKPKGWIPPEEKITEILLRRTFS